MQHKVVCVVGLGYIGLPTAALLATAGYTVVGADLNSRAVETINRGQIHIVEPDLDAYVRSAVTAGKLKAFGVPQPADIYMICVPTPFHKAEGIPQPNINFVLEATRRIAPLIKPGDMIILESTSPVGTTRHIGEVLRQAGVDISTVHLAYCPERVLPGKIMMELVENDRVVGGLTPEATCTDAATAEMCKLTENSYRDVNIAFANELSLLCANVGIDVWKLIKLANRHPRVSILQPGTGVGGHCIAVDPWFLVSQDPNTARLIHTARRVNDSKTEWVIDHIQSVASRLGHLKDKRAKIACFGMTFKPDIDDVRESPAIRVIESLIREGYETIVVEPNIQSHTSMQLTSVEEALDQADIIALLVKHREFVQLFQSGLLSDERVLDFCGVST
jgi:UDP-N-acetyl-D-mannosaminuronic acid dehydrogenase